MKHKVTIPGYGDAESLNAAVAAGIVMEKMARAAFSK
jgi:tRNA G18 (ribose-2'-O)-methylase SpoU